MKAGTGVKVAASVNVGMIVAVGDGVQVGGRVCGAGVERGAGGVMRLLQAESNTIRNTLRDTFLCKMPLSELEIKFENRSAPLLHQKCIRKYRWKYVKREYPALARL